MKICDVVMNLTFPCKNCGHNFFLVKYVKPHVGIYCHKCSKWQKWLSKKEKQKYNIITPDDLKDEPERTKTEFMFIDDTPLINFTDDEVTKNILNSIDDEEVPWY